MAKKMKQRHKRKNTSIFFLLWTVFSLFCMVIVLLFGISQRFLLKDSYRKIIAEDVARCGSAMEKDLAQVQGGEEDYNQLIYENTIAYDMAIFIFDTDGGILYPSVLTDDFDAETMHLQKRIQTLQKQLSKGKDVALYESGGEYIYGAKITLGGNPTYLYIFKSLAISSSVTRDMTIRTLTMSAVVLILSFVSLGGISNWFTRPLEEMTQKAKLLASGDFSVNFQGSSYGSELVVLADTLNHVKEEMGKADQMQKELIANISHDFKTPLTMIKAYASMIQEISGEDAKKREKHAQVIIDETDRLTALVTDVLDISKIQAGVDTLSKEVFDLSAYTRDVLGKFNYLEEEQNYTILAEVDEGLFTRADKGKIGQVLYNLIGNAINYTGEDKKIFVRLKRMQETLVFSVRDTGVGIEKEEIDGIWERYYRSKEMHKRPVKGTGLGLSIVKAILEKHEFRFGVESVKGKGSVFYVVFPLWDK